MLNEFAELIDNITGDGIHPNFTDELILYTLYRELYFYIIECDYNSYTETYKFNNNCDRIYYLEDGYYMYSLLHRLEHNLKYINNNPIHRNIDSIVDRIVHHITNGISRKCTYTSKYSHVGYNYHRIITIINNDHHKYDMLKHFFEQHHVTTFFDAVDTHAQQTMKSYDPHIHTHLKRAFTTLFGAMSSFRKRIASSPWLYSAVTNYIMNDVNAVHNGHVDNYTRLRMLDIYNIIDNWACIIYEHAN